jgi:hypothetical protein
LLLPLRVVHVKAPCEIQDHFFWLTEIMGLIHGSIKYNENILA